MHKPDGHMGQGRERERWGQLKNHMLSGFFFFCPPPFTKLNRTGFLIHPHTHTRPSQLHIQTLSSFTKRSFFCSSVRNVWRPFSLSEGSLEHRIDSGSSRKFCCGYGAGEGDLKALCKSPDVSQTLLSICFPGVNRNWTLRNQMTSARVGQSCR